MPYFIKIGLAISPPDHIEENCRQSNIDWDWKTENRGWFTSPSKNWSIEDLYFHTVISLSLLRK